MFKSNINFASAMDYLKKIFNTKIFRVNYRIVLCALVIMTGTLYKANANFTETGCDGFFDPFQKSLWCEGCCEDIIPGEGIGIVHFCGLTESECADFEYPDESNRGECPVCVHIEKLEGDYSAEDVYEVTHVPTGITILVTDWEKEDDGEGGFYINFETYEGDGG